MNGHVSASDPKHSISLTESLGSLALSADGIESEGDDMELELQDYSDDSEAESSYEDEIEGNEKESTLIGDASKKNDVNGEMEEINRRMELVPLGIEEDGEDIDSEEERDILKEIREEIQTKVRSEMKEEIQLYKAKVAAIEQGEIPGDQERKERKEEEENLDPLIQEALIKMRKLDRILMKKLKREREVKRDRILLEKRIREEIQNIKPEGREYKEVMVNTDKFVSLALPPSHNEGVSIAPEPTTPLFQTQLNENEFADRMSSSSKEDGRNTVGDTESTSSIGGETSNRSGESCKNRKKKRKKDFIKRNKELAANADETIAMTEEERKRVGELLTDLDSWEEEPEEEENCNSDRPFQMLPMKIGEGYCGDELEVSSLARIDGQLKDLLPEEDFQSLVSTTPYSTARDSEHKLFTRVDIRSVGDIECYGERALIETKEQREMKARLQRIEEELSRFNNPEEIEIETPHLNDETLKGLLDQCVRSLSRTSYADTFSVDDSTPRSEVSSVVSVLENPPHLSEEVLQQLLAEAHFPLSSKLEAVREEEEELREGGESAVEPSEKILAETWKAIAESEAYTDDLENVETESVSSTTSTLRWRQDVDLEDDNKRLVLPRISQSPFLVSQGLNNQIPRNETYNRHNLDNPGSSHSNNMNIVRNNLYEMGSEHSWMEDKSDSTMTPRPPSSGRNSSADFSNRSRTVTPLMQT